MGLFDFFRRKKEQVIPVNEAIIEKERFIDENPPVKELKEGIAEFEVSGLSKVYQYLKIDFETMGYDDALCIPDVSYKEKNKSIIRNKLKILIDEQKVVYAESLRVVRFHIKTREEAGLITVVDELKVKEANLLDHYQVIQQMENDLANEVPYILSMLLSYERGFLRGLYAISLETINNVKS